MLIPIWVWVFAPLVTRSTRKVVASKDFGYLSMICKKQIEQNAGHKKGNEKICNFDILNEKMEKVG